MGTSDASVFSPENLPLSTDDQIGVLQEEISDLKKDMALVWMALKATQKILYEVSKKNEGNS